jgi:[ribosomal protein S18]-alanine N-acetyltransferase
MLKSDRYERMALSSHIIPQQPVQLGPISQYGDAEFARLVNQRRIFNRLDWWSLYEWQASDAFCAIASGEAVDAALLVVPVALTDRETLQSAQSSCAWLRWCAVRDGLSAAATLRPLFQYCEAQLCQVGIAESFCIVEPTHWFYTYVRDLGYAHNDDVVTMICRHPFRQIMPALAAEEIIIRQAREADLDEIRAVDVSAFVEQWQYPLFVLQRALISSAYFSIALRHRQIIGYLFATCNEEDAHITRLAVRADYQGQGVGAELLCNGLQHLEHDIRAHVVTLNTQQSNLVSQRLYRHFGFEIMQPVMRVMHKRLDAVIS